MRLLRLGLLITVTLSVTSCGKDTPPTAPTPEPTLVRMDIDGPTLRSVDAPGATTQLRAIAQLSDGSRPDVTNEAVWTVVNPAVLTVSRGLVTGLAIGGTIVTASYRGWSSVTNVTVGPNGGRPTFALTAVVRDADSGTPLPGAQFRQEGSSNRIVVAVTDDTGFADLGSVSRQFAAVVTRFGYQDAIVSVTAVQEPTLLDVRMQPNGPFVERVMTGTFDAPPVQGGESRTTIRLNTRAGGVLDALLRSSECRPGVELFIRGESGGRSFLSEDERCGARLRFVVPAPDVTLTLVGIGATGWQLTYREPR